MRKLKRDRDYSARPVKVFRDELELIIEILSPTCEEIKIESGEFEYDSLEELKRHAGNEIKELSIRGHRPSLYVHMRRLPFGTNIWTPDIGSTEGAFLRIKDILSQHKRIIGFSPTISLLRRHEYQSFWSRNKDRIIVGIICTLVGALATWVLL